MKREANMEQFNLFMYGSEEREQLLSTELSGSNYRITKRELQEMQEEFRRQKEAYERKNHTLMSDERKKALYG